ncbi:hypothetical protein vseg_021407 [Gypsophila vaccaria]
MGVDDPLCYPRYDHGGVCGYSVAYARGRTSGFMGRDNIVFQHSRTGAPEVFYGYAFGCGLQNRDFAFGASTGSQNVIAGIQGLAPGRRSILNQLEDRIEGQFSYCLPSENNASPPMSTMYFGDDAYISGDEDREVQVIAMDIKNTYFLYLNRISVDGIEVPIDPSIFQFRRTRRAYGGFFIDSGAPYMVLARSAYNPFRDAIFSYFEDNYGLHPEPATTAFEINYVSHDHDIEFPTIILHFDGPDHSSEVDMVLHKQNMFQEFNYHGEYRFGMMLLAVNDPGPSVLGAYQQANFKFLFDIPNHVLYFVPEICREN